MTTRQSTGCHYPTLQESWTEFSRTFLLQARSPLLRITMAIVVCGTTIGCKVANILPSRASECGIPVLGTDECCPPEEYRGVPRAIGQVDLEQYGRRLQRGDLLADKVIPWTPGADCDGRQSAMERLIGRRRLGHSLPVLGWLGVGRYSHPGESAAPRTPEFEQAIIDNAMICFCVSNSIDVQGVRVRDDDVLVSDGQHITKLIDGSDIGTNDLEIDALTVLDSGRFLISYAKDFTVDSDHLLPGISGLIRDEDILLFEARTLGEQTRGTFSLFIDGSEIGLGEDGVDVDALDLLPDSSIIVSIEGSFRIGANKVNEADLLKYTPGPASDAHKGKWSVYVDSSDVALKDQNTDAVAITSDGTILLSTEDAFQAGDRIINSADIFSYIIQQTGQEFRGKIGPVHVLNDDIDPGESNITAISMMERTTATPIVAVP